MSSKYLKSLVFRHAALENKIANENKRPFPHVTYLNILKKRKLRIKDELLTADGAPV